MLGNKSQKIFRKLLITGCIVGMIGQPVSVLAAEETMASDTEMLSESASEVYDEADLETQSKPEVETEAETEVEEKTEIETGAETATGAGTETETEIETETKNEIETETENKIETESETEISGEKVENSWRFENGVWSGAYAVSPYGATDYEPWTKTDGGYINSAGNVIPNAISRGVDVSEWQGKIDWEKVLGDDISFAMIRCGSSLSYDDKYWEYNTSECERLGIPYGSYFYSYAEDEEEAKKEAEHALRLLKGKNLSYPIYYDLEDNTVRYETLEDGTVRQRSAEDIAKIARAFCKTLEDAGYSVSVYANTDWWNNVLTDDYFNRFEDRWVAQYNEKCTYKGAYDFWQCTNTGKVDGITGNVDIDFKIDSSITGGIISTTGKGTEKYENGQWYYYYEDGSLATGWVKHHGKQYYYDQEGVMQHGLVSINGQTYGFDEWSGVLLTGEHIFTDTVNNDWYYFDENGLMQTGWVKHDDHRYYYDENGIMVHGIMKIGGKTYGFNEWTGVLLSGEHHFTDTVNDDWYYFDPKTGEMATGWTDYNGHRYYFESNGKMYHGEKYIDGYWYYLDEWTGVMATGWVTHHNEWYYYDENGHMYHGEHFMDSHWYYFDEVTGVTANKGLTYHHGHWYYYNDYGYMQYGKQYIHGKWYYFDEITGIMK